MGYTQPGATLDTDDTDAPSDTDDLSITDDLDALPTDSHGNPYCILDLDKDQRLLLAMDIHNASNKFTIELLHRYVDDLSVGSEDLRQGITTMEVGYMHLAEQIDILRGVRSPHPDEPVERGQVKLGQMLRLLIRANQEHPGE